MTHSRYLPDYHFFRMSCECGCSMSLQNSCMDELSFSNTACLPHKMPCTREAYTAALCCVSVGLYRGCKTGTDLCFADSLDSHIFAT